MSIDLHNTDRSLPSRSQHHKTGGGAQREQEQEQEYREPALRGTFASVMILGACIVVIWVAVFILFLVRQ